MLKKSLLRSAPALRFPCFAWVPARALLARAFTGTTVHWTVLFIRLTLLRWQVRGSPSVANPLSGIKLHWSFILFRFAHGLFASSAPQTVPPCTAPQLAKCRDAQERPKQKARFLLYSTPHLSFERALTPLRPATQTPGGASARSLARIGGGCAVPPCTALAGC